MSIRRTALILFLLNGIAVVLALLFGETPDACFRERGFITYFSFGQLSVIAFLLWQIYQNRNDRQRNLQWNKGHFVWFILSAAFLYFAMDEIFMIHEKVDLGIHWLCGIQETGVTDRLDDCIVGLYGIAGITVLYFYRRELRQFSGALPFVVAGFVTIGAMVVLDLLVNRDDVLRLLLTHEPLSYTVWQWLCAFEDVLKLLAEVLFLLATCLVFKQSQMVRQRGAI